MAREVRCSHKQVMEGGGQAAEKEGEVPRLEEGKSRQPTVVRRGYPPSRRRLQVRTCLDVLLRCCVSSYMCARAFCVGGVDAFSLLKSVLHARAAARCSAETSPPRAKKQTHRPGLKWCSAVAYSDMCISYSLPAGVLLVWYLLGPCCLDATYSS